MWGVRWVDWIVSINVIRQKVRGLGQSGLMHFGDIDNMVQTTLENIQTGWVALQVVTFVKDNCFKM